MTPDVVVNFWKDFYVPTQELDTSVSFVNPSDLAKALIKARNWSGKLTQELSTLRELKQTAEKQRSKLAHKINNLEKQILAQQGLSAASTKSKDVQRLYAFANATLEQQADIMNVDLEIEELNQEINSYAGESADIEKMLKLLANTTEWIIQYLNWYKYEMRTLE